MRKGAKTTWRMYVICCEGAGPIEGQMFRIKRDALTRKYTQFPSDAYRVERVNVVYDPTQRAAVNRTDRHE